MDSTNGWTAHVQEIEGIAGDRRSDRRYQIRLDLRWKLIRRRRVLDSGTGCTVDLSSGGILFSPGRQLPVGLNIDLAIAWPVLLHNVAALQLMATGRVVRSDDSYTAIQMVQHEFRTMAAAEHRGKGSAPVRSTLPPPQGLAQSAQAQS